jgi:hypothetical protein
MNTQEQLKQDFYKVVERLSVWAIKNKFHSNVDLLSENGCPSATDYKTIDSFNYVFGIPKDIIKSVFTVLEDGKTKTYKWTAAIDDLVAEGKICVFKHGRFFNKKTASNRYVLAKKTLKEIFADEKKVADILAFVGYTDRQRKFITKTILTKMSKQEQDVFINQEKLFKEAERKRKRRARRMAHTKDRNKIAELTKKLEELEKRLDENQAIPEDDQYELSDAEKAYADKIWNDPFDGFETAEEAEEETAKAFHAAEELSVQVDFESKGATQVEQQTEESKQPKQTNEDIDESAGYDSNYLDRLADKLKNALRRGVISYGQAKLLLKNVCYKELKMPYRIGGYDETSASMDQKRRFLSILKQIYTLMNDGKICASHYEDDPHWKTNQLTADMKFNKALGFVGNQMNLLTKITA